MLHWAVGAAVVVGAAVGSEVGAAVGAAVGATVGATVGSAVGGGGGGAGLSPSQYPPPQQQGQSLEMSAPIRKLEHIENDKSLQVSFVSGHEATANLGKLATPSHANKTICL